MSESSNKIIAEPLVWTAVYFIGAIFLPDQWINLTYKWSLAFILLGVTWLSKAHKLLTLSFDRFFPAYGGRIQIKDSIELSQSDIRKNDRYIEVEIKTDCKYGGVLFGRLLRQLRLLVRYDADFIILEPVPFRDSMVLNEGNIVLNPITESHQICRYKFHVILADKSDKTVGNIEFSLTSNSDWRIARFLTEKVMFRGAKVLLVPIKINVR